jgi:hypothetical protein
MTRCNQARRLRLTAFLALGPLLIGCSGVDSGGTDPSKVQTAQQQLKAIQDNPNIPPAAKAQAEAAFESHQGMGNYQPKH